VGEDIVRVHPTRTRYLRDVPVSKIPVTEVGRWVLTCPGVQYIDAGSGGWVGWNKGSQLCGNSLTIYVKMLNQHGAHSAQLLRTWGQLALAASKTCVGVDGPGC